MVQAYASLHTANPNSQTDNEVSYQGYKRVLVDFGERFGDIPVDICFPVIESSNDQVITHFCIGAAEEGEGAAFAILHAMPYIEVKQGTPPRIIVTNITPEDGYPARMNPIAKLIHKLVMAGEMKTVDMPHTLFATVNIELEQFGMEVMKVVREGAATMVAASHLH